METNTEHTLPSLHDSKPLLGVVCPNCRKEPTFRMVETVAGQPHWSFECECHEQTGSTKEYAKEKYWLWHPSNNA